MAGTFAGIFGIKMWGKRKSYLIALLGVIISAFTLCKLMWFFFNYFENNFVWLENWIWNLCNFFSTVLAAYGLIYLPRNTRSFEQERITSDEETSTIPLICFCSMRFFTTITMLVKFHIWLFIISKRIIE